MRRIMTGLVLMVVVAFVCGTHQAAAAADPVDERGPVETVELFWEKIREGDTDGAIALHTFSKQTQNHVERLKAEYTTWAGLFKKEDLSVTIGRSQTHGSAAVVMVTCDEGQRNAKPDPAYLVRQQGTWKMLMPGIPGDASAHGLDPETVAAMKRLKTWATRRRQN